MDGPSFEVGHWFDCVEPAFSFALSIEEEMVNSVNLFPNPAADILKIKFPKTLLSPISLRIYDLSGKEIKELYYENSNSGIITVPISEISKGYYLLKLSEGNKMLRILPFAVMR